LSAASDGPLSGEIRWAALRAFTDPLRLRLLFAGGLADAAALRRFLFEIVPQARREIARIERLTETIPDAGLRAKAVHGLHAKGYHIAGACVFATFLPEPQRDRFIKIVAPLETIYDFLDTVGDSDPVPDAAASRAMHAALADALDARRPVRPYFSNGTDDCGFLARLVADVRAGLAGIAGLDSVGERFNAAAHLYAETQTLKHLPANERRAAMEDAFACDASRAGITWFEYAAAAGSQFHVYAPLFSLLAGNAAEARAAYDAYFPHAAALHVLLDAFIDRDEDRAHGELNWVDCYGAVTEFDARVAQLAKQSGEDVSVLAAPSAHRFSLRLMLLFYLTHPKVWQQRLQSHARRLLRLAGAEMI
jgi:tetraprenyl-beta-curcumene synthase